MAQPLTADDVLPLVARLDPRERLRLARLLDAKNWDARAYQAAPPGEEEFATEDDPLAWDADGWATLIS
jgi:hypothetical protein